MKAIYLSVVSLLMIASSSGHAATWLARCQLNPNLLVWAHDDGTAEIIEYKKDKNSWMKPDWKVVANMSSERMNNGMIVYSFYSSSSRYVTSNGLVAELTDFGGGKGELKWNRVKEGNKVSVKKYRCTMN